MIKRALFFCLIFTVLTRAYSQVNVKDSIVFAPLIIPTGGFHFPLGDIQSTYKLTYHVGGEVLIKTKKNWLFGVSGEFQFGENVNVPNLFDGLSPFIGQFGFQASMELGMRGFNFMGQAGKIIPLFKKPNKNSGLMLLFGAGFMQHQLLINARGDNFPYLSGEYLKGYDRLHNGFAMSQYIGYIYMGNNRSVNFKAGFEFIEGFTRNRRGYNYDTKQPDNADKFDFYIGLKVGYVFPLYSKKKGSKSSNTKEFIYQ